MPSSHTATVSGLAASAAAFQDLSSPDFAITLILAFIGIYDALNVRYVAGLHSDILNAMREDDYKNGKKTYFDKPLKDKLGHLNPNMRSTYAQYFVKFVQAFAQQGIHIHAVTPQNEPLNQGNCASLFMPWDEQAEFIPHLAAAFKKAGLTTNDYRLAEGDELDNAKTSGYGKKNDMFINSVSKNLGGKMVSNLNAEINSNKGGSRNNTNQVRVSRKKKKKKEDPATFQKNGGQWDSAYPLSAEQCLSSCLPGEQADLPHPD